MSPKASPRASMSGWRRHPLLWAQWLASRNALRRFQEDRHAALRAIVAISAAALLLFAMFRTSQALSTRVFNVISDYRGLAAVLLALYASMTSNSRRAAMTKAHAESWLASTPIPSAQLRVSATILGLLPLVGRCLAVAAILALFGASARQPIADVANVIAVCVSGMLVGVAIGWWLPRTIRARGDDDARYLPAPESVTEFLPRLDALERWPTRQTRAWSRPENVRLILVAALFAVQGGSSALTGLCVVATWLLAAYLSGSLAALVRSGREAAEWLRSTPITFARFAWPLARGVLLRQFVGALFVFTGIVLLGASPASAAYVCALWFTLVVVVATLSLADNYRGRAPGLRLILSLSALAGVESRQQGWSIPVALALVVWQLRRRAYP